jgi:hypothetical protein
MVLKLNNDIEPDRFGDDWGFYIDIDNETAVKTVPNNEYIIRQKYNVKKYCQGTRYDNDIDEYDYYIKNYKNDDDDDCIDRSIFSKNETGKIKSNLVSNIVRVSSTTIITVALTYVIFFIL